jgi:hypothetical protein
MIGYSHCCAVGGGGRRSVNLCTEIHHHAHHWHYSSFRSPSISLLALVRVGSLCTSVLRWLERRPRGLSQRLGPIGAIIVGAVTGAVTLLLGQVALATVRSPLIRGTIALLFAVPAALAGYHAALGLAHVAIPGEGWQDAMAVAAAIIVASTALLRMTLFSSNELGYGVATGLTSSGLLSSQTLACTH